MIRIAITGPESCGKTTLSKALAEHFRNQYIPEYGRLFLEENGPEYNQPDLDQIAIGHAHSICASKNEVSIVDTDFIVLKVWSKVKYNKVSKKIVDLIDQNMFDLHILCSPDIPWEEDPLRENPADREMLFELYMQELMEHRKNFIVVQGSHEERLRKSLRAINKL